MLGYRALAMPLLHGLERKHADTASDVVYYGLTVAGIAFRCVAGESYSIFTSRLPEAVRRRLGFARRPMQYLSDVAISQIGGFTKLNFLLSRHEAADFTRENVARAANGSRCSGSMHKSPELPEYPPGR
jgi:hypothetical protein